MNTYWIEIKGWIITTWNSWEDWQQVAFMIACAFITGWLLG